MGLRCLYFTHGLPGPQCVYRYQSARACTKSQVIHWECKLSSRCFPIHNPRCLPTLPLYAPFFFLSPVCFTRCFPILSFYLNNWAVAEDGVIMSSLPRTHSGQRNWWRCYLPVARPCPKYHTQCHEIHVRPWKRSPCISVCLLCPLLGTSRWRGPQMASRTASPTPHTKVRLYEIHQGRYDLEVALISITGLATVQF